jgi:hypothetical protein
MLSRNDWLFLFPASFFVREQLELDFYNFPCWPGYICFENFISSRNFCTFCTIRLIIGKRQHTQPNFLGYNH